MRLKFDKVPDYRKMHYIGDVDMYDGIFPLLVVLSRLNLIKFIGFDNHIVFTR